MTERHVVVVGGGFAGLAATRALKRSPCRVTLIDATGHHLFQPLLYQVATGILAQGEVARPLREILRKQRNASVLLGEVTSLDLDRKRVVSSLRGSTTVTAYDTLIVAAGATHSYFGRDDFAEHAPGLKTIDDALEIRARIFEAFELAEAAHDRAERCRHLTFVVVGGGPTGIEVAGQIAELTRLSLRRNFSHIDPAESRVVLIEAGPRLLATFGEALSERAVHDLERLGVEVLTGSAVTHVDPAGVRYRTDDRELLLPCTTKVWAAGVAAASLGGVLREALEVGASRSGQLEVRPDCTLAGQEDVFVVGDLMHWPGTPGTAQLAIQSGRFAARVISARLAGRQPPTAFRFRDKGSLATIAKRRAVARIGGIRLTGLLAWWAWLLVHVTTLNGFRNRTLVSVKWAMTFLLNSRPDRAATAAQARHRVALDLRKAGSDAGATDPGRTGADIVDAAAADRTGSG